MEESELTQALKNAEHKVIEYDTKYNQKLRAVTDQQITTVEISPTGSGKSHFYKNSPNTLMLMPSNSMVIQNGGVVSGKKAAELKEQNKDFRTDWKDIDTTKCDYMTYDKFYGHVVEGHNSAGNYNIIIDEAHLLLATDNERYQKLAMALLDRKIQYKELKFISATLRVEGFALFNKHKFDIHIYQKKDFTPHIHFTKVFPKVKPTERTLIFINSVDKMYQIEDYLEKKYEDIKTMTLSSGDPLPSEQEIEACNVIMSTSVIRQGFSIDAAINKIIIYNVNNSEGAIEVLQYMARPRNQTPEVYVVMASTHFDMKNKPEGKQELELRQEMEDMIKKQNPTRDKHTIVAIALAVESWATKVHQAQYFNNPVLSNYLFEKEMKSIELYMTDGAYMELSIKDFLPHATIDIDVMLKELEEIQFDKLDISGYKTKLSKLNSSGDIVKDVTKKIYEFIEDVHNDTKLTKVDKNRIIKKLEKIAKVEPLKDFTMNNVQYQYTNEIIVKQMIDEYTLQRCGWHQLNLEKDNYEFIKKSTHSTRRLKINDNLKVTMIARKVEFMQKKVEASNAEGVELLERMYSFDKYRIDEKTKEPVKIKTKTSKKTKYVIITSLYPVLDNWYFKANP